MVRSCFIIVFWGMALVSESKAQSTDTVKLKPVEIQGEQSGEVTNANGAILSQKLNENEFKKAACCTLSESFDLSNAIEVSNADGVSGIKQVEMLGLHSRYVLLTRDNIPLFQGLAVLNGLSNIPGPFVSDVNIAKGTGSATLGYEGITGGINYLLKASSKDPKIFINGYQSDQGRSEFNAVVKTINKKNFRNFTYLHYGNQWLATDMNKDGYSDNPLSSRLYVSNHSDFQRKHTEGQFGITVWSDGRESGKPKAGNREISSNTLDFNIYSRENRLEAYAKLGIIPENMGETTFGNVLNFSRHEMNYYIRTNQSNTMRTYRAAESRANYSGLIQSELSENWGIKAGVTAMAAITTQNFSGSNMNATIFAYNLSQEFVENQVGAFSEFVFQKKNITVVSGIRADYHNYFGWFAVPRLHGKWEINKKNKVFFQTGMARRNPTVIAENLPYLFSDRRIAINGKFLEQVSAGNALPFYMQQEQGWNSGISYIKNFMFLGFPSDIMLDVFRTQFISQVVIDRDANLNSINLVQNSGDKAGYTESFHAEWSFIPLMRFKVKLAYRYVNNQQFLNNQFQIQPFQSKHRGLVTLHYKTRNQWYFDLLSQINGPKRIVNYEITNNNTEYSPTYAIVNLQIRKVLKKGWEFYTGMENIGDFKQNNPIFERYNLVGTKFTDPGFGWGPANGRMSYVGFRWEIK